MSSIDESVKDLIDTAEGFGRGMVSVENVELARLWLNSLIAAALADAERRGAEVMREACEKAVWLTRIESELPDSDDKGVSGWLEFAEDRVRRSPIPIPLPTGERQAVLLTDEQIARALHTTTGDPEDGVDFSAWARHPDGAEFLKLSRVVEALSLDANGLEVRRG